MLELFYFKRQNLRPIFVAARKNIFGQIVTLRLSHQGDNQVHIFCQIIIKERYTYMCMEFLASSSPNVPFIRTWWNIKVFIS